MNMNKASLRIEKKPMKFLLFHFISIYFIFTIYRETELVCFKTPAERYWMKWQEFDTTGLENVYTQYTSNYNSDEYI